MDPRRVKVRILGEEYTILSETGEDYIHSLADEVDRKLRELGAGMPGASRQKLAILAALNFADELQQAKEIKNDSPPVSTGTGEIEEKTRKLITMLEEGIIGDL
ncbi:cell division protein ZapA [Leptospira kmetyi]|uniref:Cell division protein ZapA n=1 Tax=Leptospira kmetyi TaxID=408139 RepID=A0A5F1XZ08_9LEPT|nr:cell division protein ZapA [Leptospira kmetyi]AYV56899.1 cell division protein ZapA [Leptospira kmetyi]EQA52316.1 cell division protein ZapA [Leptospira kmetyi serovar Malaysia str. Bejo-Iso9]PJZ27943.1 cell division protein ZapA [Leptospira kmetyi]TGK21736.1 cell division protein ZapA [Leptospira kmetyi]TGK28663.1 cell division protein ZapA [Leptospira kmetyi]